MHGSQAWGAWVFCCGERGVKLILIFMWIISGWAICLWDYNRNGDLRKDTATICGMCVIMGGVLGPIGFVPAMFANRPGVWPNT